MRCAISAAKKLARKLRLLKPNAAAGPRKTTFESSKSADRLEYRLPKKRVKRSSKRSARRSKRPRKRGGSERKRRRLGKRSLKKSRRNARLNERLSGRSARPSDRPSGKRKKGSVSVDTNASGKNGGRGGSERKNVSEKNLASAMPEPGIDRDIGIAPAIVRGDEVPTEALLMPVCRRPTKISKPLRWKNFLERAKDSPDPKLDRSLKKTILWNRHLAKSYRRNPLYLATQLRPDSPN